MSDLVTIMQALESALQTIPNVRTSAYLPDTITPPILVVGDSSITYHASAGTGSTPIEVVVHAIVARPSERPAIELLEAFMSRSGDSSVIAAVEADRTLGGTVSSVTVKKAGPSSQLEIEGVVYLSLPFEIQIYD